jgi:hypothetical protein
LHALYEPVFDGPKAPDLSLPPQRQLVVTPDGASTAPNPKPGGRFLQTGGSVFTIDDRWPGMTGRLFVRILLPGDDVRVLRTVGGPWHEFEVEGINYGPTEDTYTNHQKDRKAHDRENSVGLGGWRIELSPNDKPAAVNFLAVLQAADQSTAAMVPVERIEQSGQLGARVGVDGTVYEVTFATDGPPGGHIKISQAGKPVVDRALAAGVEDNYTKWSGDPRYKTWMTQPEYKSFIGAREADGYRP